MRRGDIVTAVLPGDFGKPRPAVVIQDNAFSDLRSTVLCPLTSTIQLNVEAFRVDIEPTPTNGLREPSQIVVDRLTSLLKTRVGSVVGQAGEETMTQVDRALARFLGLA